MNTPPLTKDALKTYVDKLGFNIGDHTYGTPSIMWWGEKAKLTIGKFCSIADGVSIFLGGNHRTDWVTTYPFPTLPNHWPAAQNITGHPATKGDINIGHDVWLAQQCVIMSGVTIGHGSVIGMRSLITKDVPPYSIVGGNPGKVIGQRFTDKQIEQLLAISWWDWPVEKITEFIPKLLQTDIDHFIEAAQNAA